MASLHAHKCPKMPLFRRVVCSPMYVAEPDKLYSEYGVVPITQLAHVCDVAMLQLLSSVTDKTDFRSIVWALEYTICKSVVMECPMTASTLSLVLAALPLVMLPRP